LDGSWSIAGNREEFFRRGNGPGFLAFANRRRASIYGNLAVDLKRDGRLALDREAQRRAATRGAQSSCERHWLTEVGELEVGFERERLDVVHNRIALLPDFLFVHVQAEPAGFGSWGRLSPQNRGCEGQRNEARKAEFKPQTFVPITHEFS